MTAGVLDEPVNALTSAAFVVAGAGVLLTRPRGAPGNVVLVRRQQTVFGLLVVGTGVGSFIQHGPHPSWQVYAHDLPLTAVLLFIATDAVSDLAGRELSQRWWLLPSAVMVAVVAAGPTASTVVQGLVGTAAVGLTLVRARRRPALRRRLIAALLTGAAGAAVAEASDRHGVWHVLAATALWLSAAAVGERGRAALPKPRVGRAVRRR